MNWVPFAILNILIYAGRAMLRKKLLQRVPEMVLLWFLCLISSIALIPFVFGNLNLTMIWAFSLMLLGAGALYAFVDSFNYKLMKKMDVSLAVPLENASIFSALFFGWLLLGEKLNPYNLIGLIIVVFGVYVLELDLSKHSIWQPIKKLAADRNSQLVILIAVIFGFLKVWDKFGILIFGPVQWIWLMFSIEAILLTPVVLKNFTTKEITNTIKLPVVWLYSLTGCLYFIFEAFILSDIYVVYAQIIGVIGLLLTIVLSHFIYREKNWLERLTGSLLIGSGTIILAFIGH